MKNIPSIFVDDPEKIPEGFVEAWNQRDAMAIAGLFAEDAEFVNVVGLWWHDRQAIWKAHDYGLKKIFKDSTLELRQKKVRMLSDEVALVHARMRLSGQTAHGEVQQAGVRFNVFTFVVKKEEKGWICVAAHNTDQVPGKETNIVGEDGKIRSVDYREKT